MTVTSHWPDVALRIRKNIHLAVADVGFEVERQIVGNITTQGLVDTGNYRRSWTTTAEGDEAEVGSPVEYGVYLEYGTRFMPARAHVVPAAKKIAMRVTEFFRGLDR